MPPESGPARAGYSNASVGIRIVKHDGAAICLYLSFAFIRSISLCCEAMISLQSC